jgi:peptidoglycan lytic transglycosylase
VEPAGRRVIRSRVELARASALALRIAAVVVAGAVLLGCATDAEARRPARAGKSVETGDASYYGAKFNGRRTASGERYDPRKLTAAHKSLPLGTLIRVTRTSGGADGPSVEVRVNDRCGCTHGRIVDLSQVAAQRLHMLNAGVVPVRLEVVSR